KPPRPWCRSVRRPSRRSLALARHDEASHAEERTKCASRSMDACMKRGAFASFAVGLTFGCALAFSFDAKAESPAEFYRKRQIRMIVGHEAGNDYDLAARFLARYLGRHIPGEPTITVQNMPAAASLAAANYLYAQAPRDGSVIGSFSRN